MKQQKESVDKNAEPLPPLPQILDPNEQKFVKKHYQNIDAIVRPIIDFTQLKIEKDFLSLHNKYLLQSYKRKITCFEKFLKPQVPVQDKTSKKLDKNSKSQKKKMSSDQKPTTQQKPIQPFKPTSQGILNYYSCFDQQINTATLRYQKIHRKSEENKIKLINCIEQCSINSKQDNKLFENCADNCKSKYMQVISKLYTNFYTKFLDKE